VSNTTTAGLIREYGAAVRGDWSDLDARSVRNVLDELADMVDQHGGEVLPMDLVAQRRAMYGLCRFGGGHWERYCSDYHEHTEASDD
jgi:hypothetical protein